MINLDFRLRFIGIQLVVPQSAKGDLGWIDVEATLLEALLICRDDLKLFDLLCSWGHVYGDKIIAEKFIKKYKEIIKEQGRNIWVDMFLMFLTEEGDRRFKHFINKYKKKTYPRDYYASGVKLKGPDPHFEKYNILFPLGYVKATPKSILPPEMLVKKNKVMRNRYIIGPNWRSDIISAIELGFKNPYQIAKALGCSYDPAYRTFQEYAVVHEQ